MISEKLIRTDYLKYAGKALFILFVGLFIFTGCSEDPAAPPPQEEPKDNIINDNVVVPDDSHMEYVEASEGEFTFRFDGNQPAAGVGDIIVGKEEGGFLRKVNEKRVNGNTVTYVTEQASLVDAVQRCQVADTFSLDPEDLQRLEGERRYLGSQVVSSAEGVEITEDGVAILNNEVLIDDEINGVSVSAVIEDGEVSFLPDLDIGFQIEDSDLIELHAIAVGQLDYDCRLAVEVGGNLEYQMDPPIKLFTVKHTFVQMVGWVPVVEVVTFTIEAGCNLNFEAEMGMVYDLESVATARAGGRYVDSELEGVFELDPSASIRNTGWDARATATAYAYIRPQVSIELYSMAGPNLKLEPFLEVGGEVDFTQWCVSADLGYKLDLGFKAHILDYNFINESTNLASDRISLYSECEPLIESGIIFNSDPAGANIILDGMTTGLVTPDVIEDISRGDHTVRLSKEGYNDYTTDVYYSGNVITVDAVLSWPQPPIPAFNIVSPQDEANFNDNVITVSGSIELEYPDGSRVPFTGDEAILTLNGSDQILDVSGGSFSAEVGILEGSNTLRLRTTSINGDTGYSDPITVFGTFDSDDIVIVLSWNTPTSDLDLHVWNPDGEHCYWNNKRISEGFLDIDDVEGYGPETFTAADALTGTYTVMINSYYLDEDDYADAAVSIRLNGGQPETFGPYHFTVDDGNGNDPEAWWDVKIFEMDDGTLMLAVSPADPARVARIKEDMRNLPPKR